LPICSSDTYNAVNEFWDTCIQQKNKFYAKNDFLKFSNFEKKLEIAQRRPFVIPIYSKHGERVLLCSTIMGERHNAKSLSVVLCFWTNGQMNGMCEEAKNNKVTWLVCDKFGRSRPNCLKNSHVFFTRVRNGCISPNLLRKPDFFVFIAF
jgi:hypothetical protein